MTTKLSRFDERLKRFPDVCPKCGAAIAGAGSGISRTIRAGVLDHFRHNHGISIGLAFRSERDDEPFEFAFIGPVPGMTVRTWWVVAPAWPFEVVKLRPDEWVIRWTVADGPATEGVNS